MAAQLQRVLLVEDDVALREVLRIRIARACPDRFDLQYASDLASALDRVVKEPFEVVLLDLSLPDSDGLATLRRIRVAAPRLPVVVLTGTDDERRATDAIRLGAHDYLVKGVAADEVIVRSIAYAIERGRLQRELEAEQFRGRQERLRLMSERFGRPPRRTTRSFLAPLRIRAAEPFGDLARRLAETRAESQGAGQPEDSRFEAFHAIAEELVALRAGPRDVIDLFERSAQGAEDFSVVYSEEDRDDLLDLMGLLVSGYRRQCVSEEPAPRA